MSKPGKSLKALCKRLKVRLTVKRGKKRVYKSIKVLKEQCKRKKKKKKVKRKKVKKKKKKVKRKRRRKFGTSLTSMDIDEEPNPEKNHILKFRDMMDQLLKIGDRDTMLDISRRYFKINKLSKFFRAMSHLFDNKKCPESCAEMATLLNTRVGGYVYNSMDLCNTIQNINDHLSRGYSNKPASNNNNQKKPASNNYNPFTPKKLKKNKKKFALKKSGRRVQFDDSKNTTLVIPNRDDYYRPGINDDEQKEGDVAVQENFNYESFKENYENIVGNYDGYTSLTPATERAPYVYGANTEEEENLRILGNLLKDNVEYFNSTDIQRIATQLYLGSNRFRRHYRGKKRQFIRNLSELFLDPKIKTCADIKNEIVHANGVPEGTEPTDSFPNPTTSDVCTGILNLIQYISNHSIRLGPPNPDIYSVFLDETRDDILKKSLFGRRKRKKVKRKRKKVKRKKRRK